MQGWLAIAFICRFFPLQVRTLLSLQNLMRLGYTTPFHIPEATLHRIELLVHQTRYYLHLLARDVQSLRCRKVLPQHLTPKMISLAKAEAGPGEFCLQSSSQ